MGLVGRFIDSLSDAERDRVIEAPTLYSGPMFVTLDGCRCLVGEAYDYPTEDVAMSRFWFDMGYRSWHAVPQCHPANRFPNLCNRFGAERVIAACKARAAKANRVVLPEPQEVA